MTTSIPYKSTRKTGNKLIDISIPSNGAQTVRWFLPPPFVSIFGSWPKVLCKHPQRGYETLCEPIRSTSLIRSSAKRSIMTWWWPLMICGHTCVETWGVASDGFFGVAREEWEGSWVFFRRIIMVALAMVDLLESDIIRYRAAAERWQWEVMVKGKGVSISPEHDQDAIVRAIRVWCTI